MRALAAVVVVACGPTAAPISPQPKAACAVSLVDDHLAIDGKPTELAIPSDSIIDLKSWPHDRGLVVATTITNGPDAEPTGGEDAYAVDCATHAVTPLAHVDGADFGHSAIDGGTLYFTGPDGVRALDLATKQIRPITHAPVVAECEAEQAPSLDVVTAAHGGTLDFDRYPHCYAYVTDMETHMRIEHAGGEARPVRAIDTVAVEAGGAVWAGGPQCHRGLLWRSIDHGARWTAVPLPDDTLGPVAIVADRAHVGRLVVETSSCDESHVLAGGRLFATHNAGRDWEPLPMPDDMGVIDDGVGMHLRLSSRDGSIGELVITGDSAENPDQLASWQSSDGGKSWLRLPAAKVSPLVMPHEARDGAWTFRTSADGVVRVRDGRSETTYPR